jgi:hypothetical protein
VTYFSGIKQQYDEAMARFSEIESAVLGGDLSRGDEFRAAGELASQLLGRIGGSNAVGFRALEDRIMATLNLVQDRPIIGQFSPTSTEAGASAQTNSLLTSIGAHSAGQNNRLDQVVSRLDQLIGVVSRPGRGQSGSIMIGDQPGLPRLTYPGGVN